MLKRWRNASILALALAIVAPPAKAATATNIVSLNSTTYTDLGVGPILLGANGGNIIYQVADSQPSANSVGYVERSGDPPASIQTTSHIWAIGANGGNAVVSSGSVGSSSIAAVTPYGLTAIASASQFGLAPTTASTNQLTVPTGATMGRLCVRTAEVETTEDGSTPTTAPRGTAFPAGTCTWVAGHSVLATLKMISATGTVDAEYFQ